MTDPRTASRVQWTVACLVIVVAFFAGRWWPKSAAVDPDAAAETAVDEAPQAPVAASKQPKAVESPVDEPLKNWKPRGTEALGEGTSIELPIAGGLLNTRMWPARTDGRPIVVLAGPTAMELSQWQPFVAELDEVIDVNVVAIAAPEDATDDLRVTIDSMRRHVKSDSLAVVVALERAFDRALTQLAAEDGLVVIGVSPRLVSAAAKTAWNRPNLPWSLCLVGSQRDEADRVVLEGDRPETMVPRVLLVDEAADPAGLLRAPQVISSVRGWLFGLLGGHQ